MENYDRQQAIAEQRTKRDLMHDALQSGQASNAPPQKRTDTEIIREQLQTICNVNNILLSRLQAVCERGGVLHPSTIAGTDEAAIPFGIFPQIHILLNGVQTQQREISEMLQRIEDMI